MKGFDQRRGGTDKRWEDDINVLERATYTKKARLMRIVGGIFVGAQHWITSKTNKKFPLWCPSFNPHTEAHDLMHCPLCWNEFIAGRRPRPYHSSQFQVYDANGDIIDDYTQWMAQVKSPMCPIHDIPLEPISCGLCDLREQGATEKIDKANPKYMFNVILRDLQERNDPNPVQVIMAANKMINKITNLTQYNGGNGPHDPDHGMDFYLQYLENSKPVDWDVQRGDGNKPLTAEERALPLWEIDRYFRAAEKSDIEQAIRVHNLAKLPETNQAAGKMPLTRTLGAPPSMSSMASSPGAPSNMAVSPTQQPVNQEPVQQQEVVQQPVAQETSNVSAECDTFGNFGLQPNCISCDQRIACLEKQQQS